MNKILFLMSHIGANSSHLYDILSQHPFIEGFRSDKVYDHPDALNLLLMNKHKNDTAAAVYMDELLHNYRLTCKPISKICKFVFLLGEPKASINRIVADGYDLDAAVRYYCYRLRGMLEYYVRSKGVICKPQESDPVKITDYLELTEPLKWKEPNNDFEDVVPYSAVKECENCYDRYLHYLETLDKR